MHVPGNTHLPYVHCRLAPPNTVPDEMPRKCWIENQNICQNEDVRARNTPRNKRDTTRLLTGLSNAVRETRAFLWYAIMNAGCNFSQALWKEPGKNRDRCVSRATERPSNSFGSWKAAAPLHKTWARLEVQSRYWQTTQFQHSRAKIMKNLKSESGTARSW